VPPRASPLANPDGSNRRESRAHHQINVPAQGLAPLAKLGRQSLLVVLVLGRLQLLEPLVHQIQGVAYRYQAIVLTGSRGYLYLQTDSEDLTLGLLEHQP